MLNIDSRSSKPIYEQIIDKVKENIIKGILQPGDKLPSVRELSSMITANPNTISKAYKELERERAIEVIRGKGTFVALNYKPKVDEEKMKELKEWIKKIVIQAHYMGIGKEKLKNIIDEIYIDMEKGGVK